MPNVASERLRILVFVLGLGICALSFQTSLWAQGSAYLTGYVLDPSQAAMAKASVQIKNQVTGATFDLQTTDAGIYRSPALEPGTYSITVSMSGFRTSVTGDVTVEAGQPRNVNINLAIGNANQMVKVTASAPVLKTEDSGLGQSVEADQASHLPYFSRSAGSLLSLSPGVRYDGEDVVSYGASRYNIAGSTNVNVIIDGAVVNGDRTDLAQMVYNPSVETLSELKVITNQYSAEFGQDIGSLVLMQTKSGANKWHGGGYYYLRNEAFDADNRFSQSRPRDRQNMLGGQLGGPIVHDKLFFFTSQERLTQTTPIGVALTVPTEAMKQGNFAGLAPLFDPATTTCTGAVCTRTPFLNNQIPLSRFDPVAINLLKDFPSPSQPGNSNNLLTNTGFSNHRYRQVTKFDWNIGQNDTFTGVWMLDRVTNTFLGVDAYNKIDVALAPTLTSGFGFQYQTQVFNLSENHIFSPTLFVSNRIVWRPRFISRLNPAVNPSKKYAETLGIKNYAGERMPPELGGDLGFPSFNFSGYTGIGPGFLLFQEAPIHEFDYNGTVSLVRGSHTIKTGIVTEKGKHGAPDQSYPTGLFNFAPRETSDPSNAATGDAFASFLLGTVDTATTQLGPRLVWSNTYFALFAQDDWKVSPKLTLNFGLRWDVDLPVREEQNRGNAFDASKLNPVSGTPGVYEFLGLNGWPDNFFDTDWHRFAPRFGFAYQFLRKTVVRGGYGIYNTSPLLGANKRAPSDGFTTTANFSSPDGGISPAFILANGFPNYAVGGDASLLNESFGAVPVGQRPIASPTFVDRNWRMGYVQNFNLSLQRELPGDMVLEVAGQGSLGRRLPVALDLNEIPPKFWGIPGTNFARRPFPQFLDVTDVKAAVGTIDYYGGYVRFEKRFSHGLGLTANYNMQKSIGFSGGSIYFPQFSRQQTVYDEANGSVGLPIHQAAVSWAYSLPFGFGRTYLNSGPLAHLLGGWEIGGVFNVRSGIPFDVSSGTDSLNGNNANPCNLNQCTNPLLNTVATRVNLVGNPIPANQNPANWLNPAAFIAPSFGTIGSYCCAKLYGPHNAMVNATLEKNFIIKEGYNVKFVTEIFNLFNTPQWGIPDSVLTDPGFGKITGASSGTGIGVANPQDGARIMQLGLRLDF
jgi:hypothetical protein